MFGWRTWKMANTYRMTDRDIRLMIQLRATNAAIFTGRRNSAMRGWRAIRKEMGLQGMLSARQLKKKWDNLKEKYKVLKNPTEGMETLTLPSSWRWFHLMEEAMSGRLAGTANIVQPSLMDEDEEHNAALPPLILPNTGGAFPVLSVAGTGALEGVGTLREVLDLNGIKTCVVEAVNRTESAAEVVGDGEDGVHVRRPECKPTVMKSQPVINKSQTASLYVTLNPDCNAETNKTPSSSSNIVREAAEVDRKLAELLTERQALEREQAEFDRELIALERDRELLDRDKAALEQDRTTVDRDRAAAERERAFLDRDRAFLDRDRAFLDRDRAFLDRDRAFLDRDRAFLDRDRAFLERAREDAERERALLRKERAALEREGVAVDGHQADMTTEKEVVLQTRFYQSLMAADLDPDQLETRQRLFSLFQRLVEKL